jgi:hypothetical protein
MLTTPLTRLLIGAAALGLQASGLAQEPHAAPSRRVTPVQPGGALAEMTHRSALRAYAVKMAEGRLTADELIDYLAKGGSYQREKSYDRSRAFFVGDGQGSVLRFFIDGPRGSRTPLPGDRLKSLQILLDVGSDPNLQGPAKGVGGEDLLSPTLFAAAGDDLEALKLLVAKGGDIELREDKYAGRYGPALALASRTEVLDFLLNRGANLNFTDENGSNLLLLAVERTQAKHPLDKIAWLLARGLSPRAPNRWHQTAETRAQALLALADERLKAAQGLPADQAVGTAALQANRARLVAVLDLFAAPPPPGNRPGTR